MLIEQSGRVLPFSCDQVFDLAADIERYPDFLPWWLSASIQNRDGNTCCVEQVLGRGPVRVRFSSRAVLSRPQRVDISSSDSTFQEFNLSLQIVPASPAGCSLSISAHVELRSLFLQQILQQFLATSVDGVIAAFETRAYRLYDPSAPW